MENEELKVNVKIVADNKKTTEKNELEMNECIAEANERNYKAMW